MKSTRNYSEEISKLRTALEENDTVLIGAGAGLSTSAGFTYSGERFTKNFFDFANAFGINDMYSGGFYPFPSEEIRWAWWARHIYFNRYIDAPKPVYKTLLELVKDKDYFVITTNVDHQFQKAGFDKKRLFYTQGDYGLFQSTDSSIQKTYDNEEWVMKAMEAQGFVCGENGEFTLPSSLNISMQIPTELIPKCPDGGGPVTTNLRADSSFVEDDGWHQAAERYSNFLRTRTGKILLLELGVGYNTAGIIKYPFWNMTLKNPDATFASINFGDAFCPDEIKKQSILINSDIGEVLATLQHSVL